MATKDAAFRSMTIAIASYQRRAALGRLLEKLASELAAAEDVRAGLDVVVVLDGSTDGSLELVERLDFPVELRAVWQENRGLAAARNAGLAAASGELIFFLDDDVVPGPELVRRHREAHLAGKREVVVGLFEVPPDTPISTHLKRYHDRRNAELVEMGVIERADRFAAHNTSGPASVFREVGAFDERFVEYGYEDYELAIRLLRAGVRLRVDERAVAYHLPDRSVFESVSLARRAGRNAVRLARLHPEAAEWLFPPGGSRRPYRRLVTAGARGPRRLALAAAALSVGAFAEDRFGSGRHRFADHAWAASYAAGIAEADHEAEFFPRLVGAEHAP